MQGLACKFLPESSIENCGIRSESKGEGFQIVWYNSSVVHLITSYCYRISSEATKDVDVSPMNFLHVFSSGDEERKKYRGIARVSRLATVA